MKIQQIVIQATIVLDRLRFGPVREIQISRGTTITKVERVLLTVKIREDRGTDEHPCIVGQLVHKIIPFNIFRFFVSYYRNQVHLIQLAVSKISIKDINPDLSVGALEGVQVSLVGLGPLNWVGRKVDIIT